MHFTDECMVAVGLLGIAAVLGRHRKYMVSILEVASGLLTTAFLAVLACGCFSGCLAAELGALLFLLLFIPVVLRLRKQRRPELHWASAIALMATSMAAGLLLWLLGAVGAMNDIRLWQLRKAAVSAPEREQGHGSTVSTQAQADRMSDDLAGRSPVRQDD